MKTIIVALVLCFAPAAFAAETLDGTTWIVKTGEKGKPLSDKDTLTFKSGMFHSAACDAYGFGDAKYKLDAAMGFDADTDSKKEGHIHWNGFVKGDHVKGTFVWSKAGQKPIEYSFEGERKK
jgi:hypothetical protein